MGNEEIPYFSEKEWVEVVKNHKQGVLMASGEALKWANKNRNLQISNPDTQWRLNPYVPPLMGFKGAINLANLWINEQRED